MEMNPDNNVLKFSGEFASRTTEIAYLELNWPKIQRLMRSTLLVIAFMGMIFFVVDLMSGKGPQTLALLFAIRLASTGAIVLVAVYIGRSKGYAPRFEWLLFLVQLLIPVALYALAMVREVPAVYMGVDAILFTLVYYQFVGNRFSLTVAAALFFGLSAILFCALFLDFKPMEFVGAFLFLVPLNFLGITILRSINQTKRREFLALQESKRHVDEKEKLIEELQTALAEVKTLQGFIPICSKCNKIRDDKGFWEKIENYIQARTGAQFSHSLCPTCAVELYGAFVKKT